MKHLLAGIVLCALTVTASSSVWADPPDLYELFDGEAYPEDGPPFGEMGYQEAADWLIGIVEEKHPISYVLRDEKCAFLYKSRQRISEIGPPEQGGRFVHEDLVTATPLESVSDFADCDSSDVDTRVLVKTVIHLVDAEVIDYAEYEAYDFSGLRRVFLPEHHNVNMLICGEISDYDHPDLDCIEGSIERFEKEKGETVFEFKEKTDLSDYLMPIISAPHSVLDAIRIESALNRLIELAKLAKEK